MPITREIETADRGNPLALYSSTFRQLISWKGRLMCPSSFHNAFMTTFTRPPHTND